MNGIKRRKANKQNFKDSQTQEHSGESSQWADRGLADQQKVHQAYLCLGSNIQPEENLRKAIHLLRQAGEIQALSRCFETLAIGSDGESHEDEPNFLNLAVRLTTSMDASALKNEVIGAIELSLGRVRSANKYAPRPIDLDIIVFDGEVLDTNLWKRVYIALPFSELLPDLVNPQSGETLRQTAGRLLVKEQAIPRPIALLA